MVKRMLIINKNIDISSYHKLVTFLKNQSVGHEPKKSLTLSKENIVKFISKAPDDTYLMYKVNKQYIFSIFYYYI